MTTMLFRTSTSVIALVACSSFAVAADFGGPSGSLKDGYAAPAVHTWTGLYLGANVGYGWGDHESFIPEDPEGKAYVPPGGIRTDLSPDGWFGGGQVGFNYQRGSIVFGLEADWQAGDMEDRSDSSFIHTKEKNVEVGISNKVNVESLGTVRGRLGIAMGRVLPYVTGGFAWAKTDVGSTLTYPGDGDPVLFRASDSGTHIGWVVGGGVEVALDQSWSLKGEYLYYDLGEERYTIKYVGPQPGDTYGPEADLTMQTFRVGVNYKFGN